MKIKILGTGGAINNGLPYNSFMINEDLLVETPPDIMNSLFRENINREKISAIYISHFHADHFFGLPFLLLRNFDEGYSTKIKITGPEGINQRVSQTCNLAFGEDHPMQQWIKEHVTCEEIRNGKDFKIGTDYKFIPLKMFHSPETYGFVLNSGGSRIAYIADTYWEDIILEYIKDTEIVLIDLGGEKTDTKKVHISEDDLIKHALPNIKSDTKFYGIHLTEKKKSKIEKIRYVIPGEEIEV